MDVLVYFSFVSWLMLSFAVGRWAGARGRNALGWLVLSLVFSPVVGAAFVAVLPDESWEGQANRVTPQTHLRCPECREVVRRDACKCRHCGAALVPGGN